MNFPNFNIPDIRGPRDHTLADTFVDRLEKRIAVIQQRLAENEQLKVTAILPTGREILVDFIGYSNPHLVAIEGIDLATAKPATLLAHQESVQLLCSVESVEPQKPRRTIGFLHNEKSNP